MASAAAVPKHHKAVAANEAQTTPSDIVAALMFFTGAQFIESDPQQLHRAVFVAREVCPLLATFGFSHSGANPISRGFDEALGILKLTRVLRMENTDYERYIIDNQAREFIAREILPRFSDEEKRSLEGAAAILREACKGVD